MRTAPLVIVLMALFGCWGGAPPPPQTNPIGMARVAFVDDERASWTGAGARPLATTIWFPAHVGAKMTFFSFPSERPLFVGGYVARDAAIQSERRYPLVVLSHGTGGSALQMMWLGRALAEAGYIAAAIDHHGNSAAEPRFDPRGFRMPWHRARDITALLDLLLSDDVWGRRIDPTRIGAGGFSLGGYTVAALAGARTDLSRFAAFCASDARDATCDPQPEFPQAEAAFRALVESDPEIAAEIRLAGDDYEDPRIVSFAALAPAPIQAFSAASLEAIDRPMLVLGAREDQRAPITTNAAQLAGAAPGGRLAILDGANHYAFLNRCTSWRRWFLPICQDASTARDVSHRQAAKLIMDHFSATGVAPDD